MIKNKKNKLKKELIKKMDKKEFMKLREMLQQFEEEHSLELMNEKETQFLMGMIGITTDYITHFDGD